MKLLFATDRLHVPDDFSGSVQSTHALMLGLLERGHECEIIASLPRHARHFAATALHRLSGRRIILQWRDSRNGYRTLRGSCWRFVERVTRHLRAYAPQALVLDSIRMLRALESARFVPTCPIIVVIHDTMFVREAANLPLAAHTLVVANSPFTASTVTQHYGIESHMVPPLVRLRDYVTDRPAAKSLTLVSPHVRKGLNTALEIAEQLPDVPLQLVEGWPMPHTERQRLLERIRSLGNVQLLRSTADMREIYRKTWIQLVPSELETFGRVALEAQASGIPVLCTDAGALGWVVGKGGIVFSPRAPAAEWVAELRRLRHDVTEYEELAAKALQNSRREDFQPDKVLDRFEAVLASLERHQG